MNAPTKTVLALAIGITIGGLGVVVGRSGAIDAPAVPWRGDDECGPGMTGAQLDEALALGSAFMLSNQRPDGSFGYEWDWKKQTDSTDDNEVRQAGAAWGLGLILQDDPTRTDVRDALLRSLAFWSTQARAGQEGDPRRWTIYRSERRGGTGTIALLSLAHIELLRSGADLAPPVRATLERDLDGLLAMLVKQRASGGGFHSHYSPDGVPTGAPNPYADGEALLAMVKAANYLGRDDLLPLVVAWAKQDRQRNVLDPRAKEPDPNTTKGYYQWTSMLWWELLHSKAATEADWGEWLMELAVWMIDDHRTLRRMKNTAYAYEGIISAYEHANATGDPRAKQFACVIDQGIPKLTSWQLGHSLANSFVAKASADDARARGGIQNSADESPLRIDVTQHQMHAIILHRRYYPRP